MSDKLFNTKYDLIQLIKNKNNEKLETFLKENENDIDYNEQLYEIAFEVKNLKGVELLCKWNHKKNVKLGKNNSSYCCTKNLINISRNEYFDFTSNFIMTLLKYDRLDYVRYIFKNYIYNNISIIDCLVFRKKSFFQNDFINNMIKREKSKLRINIKDLLSTEKNDFRYYEYNPKDMPYFTSSYSYEKLLFLALRRKNTIAVLWILNYALVNNINLNINGKDEEGNYPVLSVLLYDFLGIILDLKINSNINDNTYNHLCDDYYIMSYIFIYSGKTNRILNLNDKNRNGDYPLLCACRNRRTNMVKMLIKYAEEHNIILNINDKNNNGQSPLSISVHSNRVEIVKTITDYAKKHNIILDIGIKYIDNMIDINDGKKYELLIAAIESNKLEIVILLMQYICEYYYIYNNLNNQNVLSCSYILSYAINKNSTELVKIVIDYAKKCYDLYGTIDYLCNIKTSSILTAINNDNLEIVILVIKYIFNDSVSYCNDFFITQILSYAIVKDSTELVKLLLNYINEFNLYSSIELAMETDKFEIIKLIIQYIIKNNINFDINHQYNCNEKLLTSATRKNNNKMVKTIIDYTTNIDKILNIVNRYDYSRHIPILQAVINDNFKMIKMIMKYVVENNVIFNPNYHENTNDNLISYALSKNDIELVIMIINYVNQNNITLDIAKYYDEDNLCSSIIYAMENDYIDMVTKVMEYSIDNNIVFNINYQVGSTGKYLLLYATFKNNIELVKKIIAYANQYNCILKIDDKDNFGNYPLYCCIKNNNTDMFRLIVDYSINKNIMPINMQNISSDKFMINYLIQYLFGVEDRYDQDYLVNKILKINKGNKRKFEMTQETQNKKVKKS